MTHFHCWPASFIQRCQWAWPAEQSCRVYLSGHAPCPLSQSNILWSRDQSISVRTRHKEAFRTNDLCDSLSRWARKLNCNDLKHFHPLVSMVIKAFLYDFGEQIFDFQRPRTELGQEFINVVTAEFSLKDGKTSSLSGLCHCRWGVQLSLLWERLSETLERGRTTPPPSITTWRWCWRSSSMMAALWSGRSVKHKHIHTLGSVVETLTRLTQFKPLKDYFSIFFFEY